MAGPLAEVLWVRLLRLPRWLRALVWVVGWPLLVLRRPPPGPGVDVAGWDRAARLAAVPWLLLVVVPAGVETMAGDGPAPASETAAAPSEVTATPPELTPPPTTPTPTPATPPSVPDPVPPVSGDRPPAAPPALTPPPVAPPSVPDQGPSGWRVVGVVDGDTVDVVSPAGVAERVRVVGIDTPERGECGFGAASAALGELVAGREVVLVPGARDDRDRYGRLLRYVDVGGVDAGLALIRAGFAVARYDSRDGYGRHAREDVYVAADRDTAHVCGVVSPADDPPPPAAGGVVVFADCAALRVVYPGGVARVGVVGNTVSGVVRPFTVSPVFDDALYDANRRRDGDGDGVACERS